MCILIDSRNLTEHDKELPQSHTTDQPTAQTKMTTSTAQENKDQTQSPHQHLEER